MPNIRVDLDTPVLNGQAVTFKSPADCSDITGLIIYYPEGDTTTSKTFKFVDAHGVDVGSGTFSLFAADALVKVILDTDEGKAYVQNADTNAYIEKTFVKKRLLGSFTMNEDNGTKNEDGNIEYNDSLQTIISTLLSECRKATGVLWAEANIGAATLKTPCAYIGPSNFSAEGLAILYPNPVTFCADECTCVGTTLAFAFTAGLSITITAYELN